ncbi:hypothetical protein niasHT_014522 [Heterodera trifolii]|uniref:BTB domain-containing protein n=1 Tax=Heterodera trifolii TaxID=157864 RepID=A0ABD2KZP0_9BILA
MPKSPTDWMKLLLSTGEYADVHFLLVPAHKLILKHASDVFEAMFRFDSQNAKADSVSANCPVVEVPDVEAAAFKVMLSFIYAGDLSGLNGHNAMAVLYAAKKYNIPGLVDASLQIPVSKLRNVFLAYAQARLFELDDFSNDCLSYIDKNADTLTKTEEFLQIDQKLLCEILAPENRRAMLGPALFKIRFPLISEEEFAKNIVPSGVLTTEEVIGVEKYKSQQNFNRISKPCQLQFPSQDRIWTEGTLLMDIEKVSEFAGAKQLMDPNNGFHNREEDKVTLAIDVIVKEVKTEKFISDPNKSNGIISMEIEKVSKFAREAIKSERKSETVHISGVPWQILAQINAKNGSIYNEKWLGVYLLCDVHEEDTNWSFKFSATFRIVSQKNGVLDFRRECDDYVFDNKKNHRGHAKFISFAELMDPEKGFYDKNEDKVTLAIDITVKEAKMEDKS